MAARVVEKFCLHIVRVRTSHTCGAFHVTSKRHYARGVKRHIPTMLSPNITTADIPPQPPPPPDDISTVVESLNDDSQFDEVMRLASSRAIRRKQNLMVLDGPRLISKALSCGVQPNAIYCSRLRDVNSELSDAVVSSGIKLYQLTSQQAKLARDQGILSPLFGCVDVMDMKVLRDASGCHFDIPFVLDLTWTQLENHLPADSHIFLADSLPSAATADEPPVVTYTEPKYADCSHVVLVVGGETEGLSRSACRLYKSSQWPIQRIHIPMSAGIDSLNSAVSASIILCEMWRQISSVAEHDGEIRQPS